MNKRQKLYFLGVLPLGAMGFCEIAQAQIPYTAPPAIHWQKPEQIRPDLYGPNGSDPAPRFRSPNQSQSSTSRYTLEQVRARASHLNALIGESPHGEAVRWRICSGRGDAEFQSFGYSLRDIAIFKNEVGC